MTYFRCHLRLPDFIPAFLSYCLPFLLFTPIQELIKPSRLFAQHGAVYIAHWRPAQWLTMAVFQSSVSNSPSRASILDIPSEIRVKIWRDLLLTARNRTLHWPLSQKTGQEFGTISERVLNVPPSNINLTNGLVYGTYLSNSLSVCHTITYILHVNILRACKDIYNECKEVLYKENNFLALIWDGCWRWRSPQDLLEDAGIGNKWSLPTFQFLHGFNRFPADKSPAVTCAVTMRSYPRVRIVSLTELDRVVEALEVALQPTHRWPNQSTPSMIELSTAIRLSIRSKGLAKEVLRRSLPWLGQYLGFASVGTIPLFGGFTDTRDRGILHYRSLVEKAISISIPERMEWEAQCIEQRLVNLESKFSHLKENASTSITDHECGEIMEELFALLHLGLTLLCACKKTYIQHFTPAQFAANTQLLRVLPIAAWHLSRMELPASLPEADRLAIHRRQLLFLLMASHMTDVVTTEQKFKTHTFLRAARLAHDMGHRAQADQYLSRAVLSTASQQQLAQWRGEGMGALKMRWVSDQLDQAWVSKVSPSGNLMAGLLLGKREKVEEDFMNKLQAWAESSGYDEMPKVSIRPEAKNEATKASI